MRAWLQRQWQRRVLPPSVWFVLVFLIPLWFLFAGLSALRRLAYRRGVLRADAKLPVPVLVVGNLTVGGTGKTPLVLALIDAFVAAGRHPGVVSRGYGGAVAGVAEVTPTASPGDVGDEPVLLARRGHCPVWVGKRRAEAARALLAAHPEVDLLVCDDGLQHYALPRDVELAVFDGRGIGNGFLLPLGPLREPLSRLAHVTALVMNGSPDPRVEAAAPDLPHFAMHLKAGTFYRLMQPQERATAAELLERYAGRQVHALAGIGHPERFFATLRDLGLAFEAHAFSDHHAYGADDLLFARDTLLLMTEKDGVKCARLDLGDAWVLPVTAAIPPELPRILLEKLNGRKTA